jgi:hypothetical protein
MYTTRGNRALGLHPILIDRTIPTRIHGGLRRTGATLRGPNNKKQEEHRDSLS